MYKDMDDILTQSDIQPGDLLFFHGFGNGCIPDLLTPGVMLAQYFLETDQWPATFVHTAICTENISAKIRILHLREVAWNRGDVCEDQPRDVLVKPFNRPIIIVRPPESLRNKIVDYARQGLGKGIQASGDAYYRSAFGESRPRIPQHATFFQTKTTCLGFMMNVLQLAYQEVEGQDFPISRDVASNKALYHIANLKREHEGFQNWKILIAPKIPDLSTALQDKTLLNFIMDYVVTYAHGLEDKYYAYGAAAKKNEVLKILELFKARDCQPQETMLEKVTTLLAQLKPVMEEPRCYFSSWSFYFLQNAIYHATGGALVELDTTSRPNHTNDRTYYSDERHYDYQFN